MRRFWRFLWPLWVLFAAHVLARVTVIVLQRNSLGFVDAPRQIAVGLGNDFFISGIAFVALVLLSLANIFWGAVFFAVVSGLIAVLLLANTLHVAFRQANIVPADFSYLRDGAVVMDSLTGALRDSPSLLAVGIVSFVIVAALVWQAFRAGLSAGFTFHSKSWRTRVVALVAVAGPLVAGRSFALSNRVILHEPVETHPATFLAWRRGVDAKLAMPLPRQGFKALHGYLRSLGARPRAESMENERDFGAEAARIPGHPSLPPTTNVMFILLESFGMPLLERRPEAAPFLLELSRKGLVFPRHFTNVYRTCGAQFSALCSNLDPPPFYVSRDFPRARLPCLPRLLSDAGWRGAWVSGSPKGFDSNGEWLSLAGLTHLVSAEDFPPSVPRFSYGVHDGPVFERLLKEARSFPRPFFIYMNTNSNHHPYIVPEDWQKAHPEYDAWLPAERTTRYTDDAVRTFFEAARKEPWFEDTLFVFFGDHLPWGHAPGNLDAPEHADIRDRYRTLAFLYHPGVASLGGRVGMSGPQVSRETSHIDLAPTVAALLGLRGTTVFLGTSALDSAHLPFIPSQENQRGAPFVLHDTVRAIVQSPLSDAPSACAVAFAGVPGFKVCSPEEAKLPALFRETFYDTAQWDVMARNGHRSTFGTLR